MEDDPCPPSSSSRSPARLEGNDSAVRASSADAAAMEALRRRLFPTPENATDAKCKSRSSSESTTADSAEPCAAKEDREDAGGSKAHASVDSIGERSATLSGASGRFLAAELKTWLRRQSKGTCTQNSLRESLEHGLAASYDRPFGWFFNFVYDVLQLSSGRDKFLALLQGFAKFASAALSAPDSERHWMYRGIEDSLSDGRKTFRLFKEHREVYKVRRGIYRCMEGVREHGVVSIMATCGCTDTLAHIASFFYYLLDNLLWAASVGVVRSKQVPKWQRKMWIGYRRDGAVLSALGGEESVKRWKNLASIWRLVFAIAGNALLLHRARRLNEGDGFQGPDDPRLFHRLELLGMAANFRILAAKLGYAKLSHKHLGLLAMLAACTGIWSNWRKVCRKKCGTKSFLTAARTCE